MSVLDNPAWHALTGSQATVAEGDEHARRFDPEVSVFSAVPDEPAPDDWDALRALVGPGTSAVVVRALVPEVPGWTARLRAPVTQMVRNPAAATNTDTISARAPVGVTVELLGAADVPEMAALVGRTRPGPFSIRTIELGTYLGVRHHGALVAMAGTRMRPPGHTEISGVCTDDAHRGRGLARLLVVRLLEEIDGRGETACLHAMTTNAPAIALYGSLGFSIRTELELALLAPPDQ